MSARIGAVVVAAAVLAGCAMTPEYGPIGQAGPWGYSDLQNPDGSYTVRVVALTSTMAHEYWDRRAAELCGGTNFQKNIFRAEIPVVTQTGYVTGPNGYGGSYTQDAYGSLIMEGYLHCGANAESTAAPAEGTVAPPEVTPVEASAPAVQ
jgi:hypothetical protein